MLYDSHIRLRAPEKGDVATLYEWENLSDEWLTSATLAPYSHSLLLSYIDNYKADPYTEGQLRLMIESALLGRTVGMIDLYNVEVRHRRACIGIMVAPPYRRQGFGTRALAMLERYCRSHLGLHQLLSAVPLCNAASLQLFKKSGYCHLATLPEYVAGKCEGQYLDVALLNKILTSQPN